MRNHRLPKPTPAAGIALLALMVALGGTAYAGFKVPNNSVGTKQLLNGAVTTKKIKNRAVTAAKINASGLTVPNAVHANTAATATNATTASNATQLGGLPASAYQTKSGYTQSSTAQALGASTVTVGAPVQVTTTGTTRLIASAFVHGTNGVVGTGVYLVCHIAIDGTAGATDTDYASPTGGFNVVDASVSPLASAVVSAGTHTVTLLCSAAGGGSPSLNVANDALAAWAVGQ